MGGVTAAGFLTVFPGTPIVGQSSSALHNTVWKLDAYSVNDTLVSPLPDAIITLKFQDDSQITGLAGVNRYFGQYSAAGSTLLITGIGSTEMAGPVPLMKQEAAYLSLLQSVKSYRVNGTVLFLSDRTGHVVLRLTRTDDFQKTTVTDPATVLPGTSWKLVSYTKGDSVVSGRDVSKITLKFSDKGNLSGFSGVNSYFATYTLKGTFITIGPVGSTKMAGSESLMSLEDTYLEILQSAKGVNLGIKYLELTDSSGNVRLAFTQQGLQSLYERPVSNPVIFQSTSTSREVLTNLKNQEIPEYVPVDPPAVTPLTPFTPALMPRYSDTITPPKSYAGGPFY